MSRRCEIPGRRCSVVLGPERGAQRLRTFSAIGTPVSGALFGIEVLYLGRIEYPVLFPCLMAGNIAHLVSGVAPRVPALPDGVDALGQTNLVMLSIAFGAVCGLVALLLIETMRALEHRLRPRATRHPYATAAVGGVILSTLFRIAGAAYAGLGCATIDAALAGDATGIGLAAPLVKIGATVLTLEVGGSGGIVTPLFFNTPIAAAVMGMELPVRVRYARTSSSGEAVTRSVRSTCNLLGIQDSCVKLPRMEPGDG